MLGAVAMLVLRISAKSSWSPPSRIGSFARFGSLRIGLAIWLLAALVAIAQISMAEEKEAQALDQAGQTSDWADIKQPPLWSFAWVTDMHMDGARLDYLAKAFRYIDEELKPHFVLFTGDNNAQPAPPTDPAQPEPLGMRRQRFLKTFLQKHLRTPYALIPGDDWPEDFDKVFGPKQYSFDCGGLHFIMLAPDRIYHGSGFEGLSVFDKPTLDWIGRDLDRSRNRPTVVAIHEPICPPTFLDARRLRELLDRYPNVVAAFQGHLHVDMEYHANGTTYLVGPSLGKPPALAMKLVNVYPEGLIVRTIPYNKSGDRFEMQRRCQKIKIAELLRGGLAAPSDAGFVMANSDAVPAHPLIDDPSLAIRVGELMKNAADFLFPSK